MASHSRCNIRTKLIQLGPQTGERVDLRQLAHGNLPSACMGEGGLDAMRHGSVQRNSTLNRSASPLHETGMATEFPSGTLSKINSLSADRRIIVEIHQSR